jgi:DNA polymerase-3 subunit chi
LAEGRCEVWFYHLERSSPEEVLPDLLERTLARGWRALVFAPDRREVELLDERLWTYRDDSFLPHGLRGGPMDARHPVLLSETPENTNEAQAFFVLGGEPFDLGGFERTMVLFDGRSEPDLARARRLWSSLKANGHEVVYWKQSETRGWTRQG